MPFLPTPCSHLQCKLPELASKAAHKASLHSCSMLQAIVVPFLQSMVSGAMGGGAGMSSQTPCLSSNEAFDLSQSLNI